MGTDLERFHPNPPPAIFNASLKHLTKPLLIGNQLLEKYRHNEALGFALVHCASAVGTARKVRDAGLPDFRAADEVSVLLYHALFGWLDCAVALDMLTALYRRLGAKMSEEGKAMMEGVLDIIENDALAVASGLWKPVEASPAILAMACEKLNATADKYYPKPAEVRLACEEAKDKLRQAYLGVTHLCDQVCKADAILLEFDYAEWQRPWLLPQHRPALGRMLELHGMSELTLVEDEDEYPNAFQRLVVAEEAKLALPAPRQTAVMREAASKVPVAKRTKRLASKKPKAKPGSAP